jgi:hypothetical protein
MHLAIKMYPGAANPQETLLLERKRPVSTSLVWNTHILGEATWLVDSRLRPAIAQ